MRLDELFSKYAVKAREISLLIPEKGRGMVYFGLGVVIGVILLAIFASVLTPYDPTKSVAAPYLPPSIKHPMFANKLVLYLWARIVYGARTILYVVFLALAVSMSAGIPIGLISGYYGGGIDKGLSLIMDAIYAFPSLVLAIALAVALGPSLMNAAISIAVVYIPTYFRMVRGQVLSIKAEQFIEEAKVLGLPTWRILLKHILPHLLSTIMVVFSLNAADAVLTEAGLSFLGLSVQFPTPDWGYDLNVGRGFMLSGYWWLVFFPGLMITLLAIGFALIGEGLSERVRREVI